MTTLWELISRRRSSGSRGSGHRSSGHRRRHGSSGQQEGRFDRLDALPGSFDALVQLSSGKVVLIGLSLAVIVAAAWQIVAQTSAINLAAADPEAALAWAPSEADALDELAIAEMTKSDGDLDMASSLAKRALRSNPLNPRALTVLGLIAERQGDRARADTLMDLSGARSWRDRTTQAWLVNRDIQRREFEHALAHVDALLRVNPNVMDQTYPVLAAFTIDQGTFDILARSLAAAPPWRPNFLYTLSGRLPDAGRLVQLYKVLQAGPNPPDSDDLMPYLNRLIGDGRFAEAYQSWRDTLPPQQRGGEARPYNGDFAAPINGLPFNWVLRPANGVDLQIVAAPGQAAGRALQLQFSGTRVGNFTVGQLMLLPPGAYRLTGKVKAEEVRTQRGLWWQISCADAPNNPLAMTNLAASAMPWTAFSVDFSIPAGACPAQWLKLEIPDRTASERQIEGQFWYESLQIKEVSEGRLPAGQ